MDLKDEHHFINFQENSKNLKHAREVYVNDSFSSDTLSCYKDCKVVGFTLNKEKSKVIRVFYNKYNDPEGDGVSESALISSIKVKTPSKRLHGGEGPVKSW